MPSSGAERACQAIVELWLMAIQEFADEVSAGLSMHDLSCSARAMPKDTNRLAQM